MPPKLLIDALGRAVRIDLAELSPADAAAVADAWRDAVAEPVEAPVAEPVEAPVVVPTASVDRAAMLESLSQQVTLAAIGDRRGDLWMLHAAGLAAPDGRVVVLVGPSGRGKTTAARTLGTRFGYVSDETVAIDDDGRVWPYRKPLSVIEGAGAPKVQRPPSELGLLPLPDAALRLAAIVLLDRHDDAPDEASIESVELGDALEDLVAQSSYLTAMPAPLQSMAALAAAAGGIRRVTYREAASLAVALDALLEEAVTPAPAGLAGGEAAAPAGLAGGEADVSRPPEPAETSAPRYSRTPYVDALDLPDPDRVAILHAAADGTGVLHLVAGVAPAIWRAADSASISALTDAALAAYGEPRGDTGALVAAAVAELVAAGVVEVDRAWRIRDDVAWVDHGDRVVVLALEDPAAAPLALEGSAAAIWLAMSEAGAASVSAIADRVADSIGVDADVVRDDVASFVAVLVESGLVGEGEEPGQG